MSKSIVESRKVQRSVSSTHSFLLDFILLIGILLTRVWRQSDVTVKIVEQIVERCTILSHS